MKKIKNLVALFAVAAIMFMLPNSTLTASAEEGTTYVVKYMDGIDEWRYQPNLSAFDESLGHGPLSYMLADLKDGDLVVVENPVASGTHTLDLGDVHLRNLTLVQAASFTIVNVKSIDNCYVLAGTASGINADINNAYVYDSALCNFGGNVAELTLYCADHPTSTLGCGGTLGHFYAPSTTLPTTYYNFYSFNKESFLLDNGNFVTTAGNFSTVPPAATPAPVGPKQPSGSTAEYDSVPKTGDNNLLFWFLGAAALSAVASISLAKGNSKNGQKACDTY